MIIIIKVKLIFVILIFSTEFMWECTSNVTSQKADQCKINAVLLDYFDIKYTPEKEENGCTNKIMNKNCDKTGITKTGLKVTLISYKLICRHCEISKRSQYYIWHHTTLHKTSEEKQMAAERGLLWFVKKDWEYINEHSTATGINWIREFSLQHPESKISF